MGDLRDPQFMHYSKYTRYMSTMKVPSNAH